MTWFKFLLFHSIIFASLKIPFSHFSCSQPIIEVIICFALYITYYFFCLLVHLIVFHIPSTLPSFVTSSLLINSFLNLYTPPSGFSITTSVPNTVSHLISYRCSFSFKILFSLIYHFVLKYRPFLSFQIPLPCFMAHFIYYHSLSTSNANIQNY